MGKTLKRQRKRIAHADARVDGALHRVAFDHRDPLWVSLEQELLGHVLVIIDEKLDAACPFVILFLLDLSSVRVGCHDHIERAWRRVADAFAVLVAYAESLWQASYEERLRFWMWLEHSDLMSSLRDKDDVPELEVHRAMLCDTFTIDFVWRSRMFDRRVVDVIYDVMVAERAVFEVKAQRAINVRPLRTAVSIMHCALSVEDVRCLCKLLTIPEVNDIESILCETHSLVELSLTGTSIKADALIALADVIETSPRRIDSLDFESSIPTKDEPAEYLAAFRRLMMALFCPTQPSHHGHGIGLSLSHNQLHAVHIEALQIALSEATRPLCSLSLDGLDGTNEATCRRVGELFFSTDARMPNDECDLYLGEPTHLPLISMAINASMEAAVMDTIPLVQQALAARVPVTCRLLISQEYLYIQVLDVVFGEDDWYAIVDHTDDDGTDPEPDWVEYSTLRFLKIGDKHIVRSRFTALDAEGWNSGSELSTMDYGRSIMNAIGPELTALSMHDYYADYYSTSSLEYMLKPCIQLKSLSLKKLFKTFQDSCLRTEHLQSLQVLQLEDCKIQPAELCSLRDRLASAPTTALRILGLKGNKLKHEGLSVVREMLRQQPQIEYVELDGEDWPSTACWSKEETECPAYAAVRAQIDRDLQLENVSNAMKMALLTVLSSYPPLEPCVILAIFEYAGRSASQRIAWSPVPRPREVRYRRPWNHKQYEQRRRLFAQLGAVAAETA